MSDDTKTKSFSLKIKNAKKIEVITSNRKESLKQFVSESSIVDEMVEEFEDGC